MKRPIRIDGDVAYVTLTKGYVAVIDAADVPLVDGFNWCAEVNARPDGTIKAVYARRKDYSGLKGKTIHMHRLIAGTPDGLETDHEDGNGLNNRKTNLRSATKAQNGRNRGKNANNTSGFKGVSFRKDIGKWMSKIAVDRKQRFLGFFRCPTAAHFAYVRASADVHGEYGRFD